MSINVPIQHTEPGWPVEDRPVLHVGAGAHDHRRVIGTEDRAVPDGCAGLDRDVAHEGGGGRDECLGMDARRPAVELEEGHEGAA